MDWAACGTCRRFDPVILPGLMMLSKSGVNMRRLGMDGPRVIGIPWQSKPTHAPPHTSKGLAAGPSPQSPRNPYGQPAKIGYAEVPGEC